MKAKKLIFRTLFMLLGISASYGALIYYYQVDTAGYEYRGLTKIGDSTETAAVGQTKFIHTFSNPVPKKDGATPTFTSLIDFSPATPFTGLFTAASFKENTRNILVGGNSVLLEIDTTIGAEAVTMTFTGFTGDVYRILPFDGSNFFLAGGSSNIVYKFDRTLAGSQTNTLALGGSITDIVKSKDAAGYYLVADSTSTIKVFDLTTEPYSGASQIATITNNDAHGIYSIAGSSQNNQEFAIGEIDPGTDVKQVTFVGTGSTIGHTFTGACASGRVSRIKAFPTAVFYHIACWRFGAAVINFGSQQIYKANNVQRIFHDVVLYDQYRISSLVVRIDTTAEYYNYKLDNFLGCHASCGACDMKISADGCTSCPANNIHSATPEGTCTPCGPTTHWINGQTCVPCHEECSGCNTNGTCQGCKKTNFVVKGSVCEECPSDCQTCNAAGECLTCLATEYVSASGRCVTCPSNCSNCSNGTGCTACNEVNFVARNTICEKCPVGCKRCDANLNCLEACTQDCLECNNSGCTQCKEKYEYEDPQCLKCPDDCQTCDPIAGTCKTCPVQQGVKYDLVDGVRCVECPADCATCNLDGTCRTCPDYPHKMTEERRCIKCPDNCTSCDSLTKCLGCDEKYEIIPKDGVEVCQRYDSRMSISQTKIEDLIYDVKVKITFVDETRRPTIEFSEDYFRAKAEPLGAEETAALSTGTSTETSGSSSTRRRLEAGSGTGTGDPAYDLGGDALETKTALEDGEWVLLIKMTELPPGGYKITMKPKENDDLVEGQAVTNVVKYDLAAQRTETVKSESRADTTSTTSKAGFNIAIIVNVIFDFLLQNLSSNGFLLKFSMIIKLINRLRFMNVQYGMALEKFLSLAGDVTSTGGDADKDRIVSRSKAKRGKFYLYNVDLEILLVMPYVLVLYSIMWFLKLLIDILMAWLYTKKSACFIFYMVINFHGKLHLMLFSMALMDISFYGARTLLHLSYNFEDRVWVYGNFAVACLGFVMIGSDLFRFITSFLNLKVDKDLVNFHSSSLNVKKLTEEEAKKEAIRKKLNVPIAKYYEIDHEKTLVSLERNYHVVGFLLGDIQTVDKRMERIPVKIALLLFTFRLPVYQVLMVTIQSAALACIPLCLLIELTLIGLNIYLIVVFNEFWTRVKTISKIIQSIGICVFLIACIYLAFIDADTAKGVPVSLLVQQISIFFIVAMIFFEYIFMVLGFVLVIINLIRSFAFSKESQYMLGGTYLRYRCFKPTIETKADGGDEDKIGEVKKNEVMIKLPMTIKEKEANQRKGILNNNNNAPTPNTHEMKKMIERSKRKMIDLKQTDVDLHF